VTTKRARDFALYIMIGIAFCVGVVWYSFASNGGGAELIGKWVGLAGTTLILFGYTIRSHRRFIRQLSFWLVMLALLVVHLSVFIIVLEKVEHWKVLWFVLAYPVENIAIDAVLSASGHDTYSRGRHRPLS